MKFTFPITSMFGDVFTNILAAIFVALSIVIVKIGLVLYYSPKGTRFSELLRRFISWWWLVRNADDDLEQACLPQFIADLEKASTIKGKLGVTVNAISYRVSNVPEASETERSD